MTELIFFHVDDQGHARMVDVGDKPQTRRTARAEARVRRSADVTRILTETGAIAKGNVIESVRLLAKTGGKSGNWTAPLQPVRGG